MTYYLCENSKLEDKGQLIEQEAARELSGF